MLSFNSLRPPEAHRSAGTAMTRASTAPTPTTPLLEASPVLCWKLGEALALEFPDEVGLVDVDLVALALAAAGVDVL